MGKEEFRLLLLEWSIDAIHQYSDKPKIEMQPREGGDIGLLNILVPKVL